MLVNHTCSDTEQVWFTSILSLPYINVGISHKSAQETLNRSALRPDVAFHSAHSSFHSFSPAVCAPLPPNYPPAESPDVIVPLVSQLLISSHVYTPLRFHLLSVRLSLCYAP